MSDNKVFISSDWEFPDGDRWHVAGFRYDGCEHFAMLTQDGDVMLMPVETLQKFAKLIK